MSKNKICGVYKITNVITNKIYIGSSNNVYQRWYEHKWDLNRKSHCNIHLQRAWDKYGEENFKHEIIELCSNDIQFEREQYWIDKTKCYKRHIGYNINKLATGGALFGEDNHFYGKTHSENSKKLISQNRQYYRKDGSKAINLNENMVEKIKIYLAYSVLTIAELAKKYEVNVCTIRDIKNNKRWTWVRSDLNEKILSKKQVTRPTYKKRIKLNGIKEFPTKLQKEIIELYKCGIIPKDIIKRGYNERTIYRTIEQYCNYKPKKNISKIELDNRTKKIKELYDKGLTNRQIEIELNLSRRVVQKTISKIREDKRAS